MRSVSHGLPARLRRHDVSRDGQKFVIAEPVEDESPSVIPVAQTGTNSSATASRTKSLETNPIALIFRLLLINPDTTNKKVLLALNILQQRHLAQF